VLGARQAALNEAFNDKKPLDGVIHVVTEGFCSRRMHEVHEVVSLDEHLAQEKASEISAVAEVCTKIRESYHRHRQPMWLLIAVAKYDLFYDRRDDVRQSYSAPDQPISIKLKELESRIGSDNFHWSVCPVCAWPESFEWEGQVIKTQLNIEQRNHFVGLFAEEIRKLCEVSHGR
jgi:hypothetical protein